MANVKITELTAYDNPQPNDVLPIVDIGLDVTKKVKITDLLNNAPAGSASRPAFSFNFDEDTGMYYGGGIRFATGGINALTISLDQFVGVGVSNPTYKLHVGDGDAQINGVIVGRGSGAVGTNVVCGTQVFENNTTGNSCTAVGFQALQANTEGNSCTAVGREALESNTTAAGNTALGRGAMQNTTTGGTNTAVGQNSLVDNTIGIRNVAVGFGAMQTNVGVARNTAVGYQAMRYANSDASATATTNVALGYQALRGSTIPANNTGESNVAIGGNTLVQTSSGFSNTACGNLALNDVTTGARNIGIGNGAGDLITTGSNNTIIGDIPGTTALANTVIVGAGTAERFRVDSSGNMLLGGTSSPASAQKALTLFNGTAPTASVTDGVVVYAEDVSSSSELKVRDEAGNVTTLSPHNFDLIPEGPSEDMAWSYYSEKDGKRINVDMLKAVRLLEQLTGEQLVFTG